jgi:hypothetical protein
MVILVDPSMVAELCLMRPPRRAVARAEVFFKTIPDQFILKMHNLPDGTIDIKLIH